MKIYFCIVKYSRDGLQWFKDYLEGCSRGVIFGRDIAPILTGPGGAPPTLIASSSAILRWVALLYLICFGVWRPLPPSDVKVEQFYCVLHVLKASGSNRGKNKKWYFLTLMSYVPPKTTTFFFWRRRISPGARNKLAPQYYFVRP